MSRRKTESQNVRKKPSLKNYNRVAVENSFTFRYSEFQTAGAEHRKAHFANVVVMNVHTGRAAEMTRV